MIYNIEYRRRYVSEILKDTINLSDFKLTESEYFIDYVGFGHYMFIIKNPDEYKDLIEEIEGKCWCDVYELPKNQVIVTMHICRFTDETPELISNEEFNSTIDLTDIVYVELSTHDLSILNVYKFMNTRGDNDTMICTIHNKQLYQDETPYKGVTCDKLNLDCLCEKSNLLSEHRMVMIVDEEESYKLWNTMFHKAISNMFYDPNLVDENYDPNNITENIRKIKEIIDKMVI